jgi:hypothetical protein
VRYCAACADRLAEEDGGQHRDFHRLQHRYSRFGDAGRRPARLRKTA